MENRVRISVAGLEEQLQLLPEPYVLMGVGVPGSGKTTVLKELADRLKVTRVSPDEIRKELTGDEAAQYVNREAWETAYARVQVGLRSGSVIFDATHTEAFRRRLDIERYHSYGAAAVAAVLFDVPLAIAKQRNAARDRVVPEAVLDRMDANLRREPVSLVEGFNRIFTLTLE